MNRFISLLLFALFSQIAKSQVSQSYMPSVNGPVNAIVRFHDVVYIGGDFTLVDSIPRKNLAAVDANTGILLPWQPDPNNSVTSFLLADNKLIVGGSFDSLAGVKRGAIGIFDLQGNTIIGNDFKFQTSFGDQALFRLNNFIYCADYDSAYNYAIRRFDINTLQKDNSWTSDQINLLGLSSIAIMGNFLYAGGNFDGVNSDFNFRLFCRFNLQTGHLDTSYHVQPGNLNNDWISQILTYQGKLYVVGSFRQIGGVNQYGVAEIDSSGNVTTKSFNCSNSQNYSIFLQGNYLWIGGNSSTIGGNFCPRIAQVNINTGYSSCWDISSSGIFNAYYVSAICVHEDTVYLGTPNISNFFKNFKAFVGNPSYINLGTDTIVCPFSPFTITADTSFQSFQWSTSATTSSILIATPGNYCVTATRSSGCKAIDCYEVLACTGISEIEKEIFSIYPNPFTDEIKITNTKAFGEIIILDLTGKILIRTKSNNGQTKINGAELYPGLYLLNYKNGSTSITKKIVKM